MGKLNVNDCEKFFHVVCICATMAMTCWCFIKYWQDEDVSLVGFVNFNGNEDNIYPALSICFFNPFFNEKLEDYGPGINTTTYSRFLQGKYWDKRMLDIEYDNVTVSLDEYLTEIGLQFANFSTKQWHSGFELGREYEDRPSIHVSNRNGKNKCFSFTIPFVSKTPIISVFTRMKASIFPNGKRDSFPTFDGSNINAGGLMVFLHYPGEHFRSYFDKKYSWNDRTNKTKNYDMIMTVKNMEVLKHRNKPEDPCNTDWKNDDTIVMEKIMKRVGCKPPHWEVPNANLKPCSTKEEIKQFKWPTYATLKHFPPPCQVIEKLQYDYEEFDDNYSNNKDEKNETGWFGISLFFPEPSYKEIKQVQAYDLESFVGNTGGYIGLFLGYAILSLPSFVVSLYKSASKQKEDLKDLVQRRRSQRNENGKDNMQESFSAMIEIQTLENESDLDKKITTILKIMTTMNERQALLEKKFSETQNCLKRNEQCETINHCCSK